MRFRVPLAATVALVLLAIGPKALDAPLFSPNTMASVLAIAPEVLPA